MYTRRISNSFRSELPEWDPRGGAVEGGGGEREREGHQILYNYRKGAIRVAGEKSEQKMSLMH